MLNPSGRVRVSAGSVIGLALTAFAAALQPLHAQDYGQVFVQVFDQRVGTLAANLHASEVVVYEDGVARQILDVRPANLPQSLTVLVDNGSATAPAFDTLRESLREFLAQRPAHEEVAIMTLAPEPRWVAGAEQNRSEIDIANVLGTLPSESNAPAQLLDGLLTAADYLAAQPLRRPVILILSGDGSDTSATLPQFELAGDMLEQHDITVHAVILTTPQISAFERRLSMPEAIAQDLSRFTRGLFRSIFLGSQPGAQLTTIADHMSARTGELARQHRIRFARPDDAPPGQIRVSVTRFGARVQVSANGQLP